MRGYRINPALAAYSLNPRRRRRGYRRNVYALNPSLGSLTRSVRGVFDINFIKQGGAGVLGLVGTITASNMLAQAVLPHLSGMLPAAVTTGYGGIALKAVVRATTAWGLDRFVLGTLGPKLRTPARAGMALAIVGSAVLELMGKTFMLGANDGGQTVHSFVPSGLAGYMRTGSTIAGVAGPRMGAYARPRLAGTAGVPTGMAGTVGNSAHKKLYSGD
jgi:hypothetical protein